jgi:hypothetical protein
LGNLKCETSSRGKAPIARDWCYRALNERNKRHPTENEVIRIKCPFKLRLETMPNIPTPYNKNVIFKISDPERPQPPPWSGYYTYYRNARLAVSNYLGVWFEIRSER